MKLPVQKQKRVRMRLDAALFVVGLLWLVTSFLLLALYKPDNTHAVQPRPHEPIAHCVALPAAAPPHLSIA